MNDVNLLLNFTDFNVSIITSGGKSKSFRPIRSKNFEEVQGCVFIVNIEMYNNPTIMHGMYGFTNYFQDMINKLTITGSDVYKEQIEKYRFLDSMYCDLKLNKSKFTATTEQNLYKRNNYKLITGNIIPQSVLLDHAKVSLYLSHYNISITLDNPINAPLMTDSTTASVVKMLGSSKFIPNSITTFIVDNVNIIGDRYMSFGSDIRKITKLKNKGYSNGLHFLVTDENGINRNEKMIPLSEIDTCGFVYKTAEEAADGVNSKKKYEDKLENYRQELELLKLDKTNEHINLKHMTEKESLDLKRIYETQLNDIKLKHESEIKSIKEQTEKLKYENDKLSMSTKYDFDKRKYDLEERTSSRKSQYEEEKFYRDNTVETIKTIGLVCSVALSGYLLLNKVSKA